jgi:hypothetical protein
MPHLLAYPARPHARLAPRCPAPPRPVPSRPASPRPAASRVVFVVRGRPGPADRPALPPGSPESWGAITENTVLHDAAYPFPIYPACR